MVLIPAAGYGKRVGEPEAKELFLHPTLNIPLIDISINRARAWNQKILVITRIEKQALVEYLKQYSDVQIQIIDPSREWADTLLKSENFWENENLVLLPDSDFECESDPFFYLKENEYCFGTFPVENGSTWGMVKAENENTYIVEKKDEKGLAWGVFGFKKRFGRSLLEAIMESHYDHEWKLLKGKAKLFEIKNYKDFTRGI